MKVFGVSMERLVEHENDVRIKIPPIKMTLRRFPYNYVLGKQDITVSWGTDCRQKGGIVS